MRSVVFEDKNSISIVDVDYKAPVFAYQAGVLVGMFVKDIDKGWRLALGYDRSSNGYHDTLYNAMEASRIFGYCYKVVA